MQEFSEELRIMIHMALINTVKFLAGIQLGIGVIVTKHLETTSAFPPRVRNRMDKNTF
jgi:hypothetical protein